MLIIHGLSSTQKKHQSLRKICTGARHGSSFWEGQWIWLKFCMQVVPTRIN